MKDSTSLKDDVFNDYYTRFRNRMSMVKITNDIKELKIEVPQGYEIDKENSSFECIKFKKKEKGIKTWEDYMLIYKNGSFGIVGETTGGFLSFDYLSINNEIV